MIVDFWYQTAMVVPPLLRMKLSNDIISYEI